ncbi:hypothetical protein [Clostridium sp. SM-530-WT-3G]|uniref:hypothetical protein n=1 Tax=Clostridium sp. SM-530-WT-3G TaxID=2725303 RepID=UPI00145D7D70|nr:hypothetical protein [Clostridium sp. SM-530-WT-3G]NME82192.1 hypothetical protein [Clostridium sp. SM-530-WT-3G]
MLYEYPDEFIVPINYIDTFENTVRKYEIKSDKCTMKSEVKDLTSDKQRKIIEEHKLKKVFRDSEESEDMLEDFVDMNVMSENYKDYYLENTNIYSDIDDEYANNEIKKK